MKSGFPRIKPVLEEAEIRGMLIRAGMTRCGWRKIPLAPFTKEEREGGMTGEEREVFLMLEIWYRRIQAW
jgi:hypothetical protein